MHQTRLQIAIAAIDKDDLLLAGVENRIRRNRQFAWRCEREFDIQKHLGFQLQAGVWHFKADLDRARLRIDLRLNVIDSG